MNNAITLSEMISQTPILTGNSSSVRPMPKFDHQITGSMEYDDSWRKFPEKYFGKIVSRKGGLSNFIPFLTNGVIVLGELINGQQSTAHLTNLQIEAMPAFMFGKQKSSTYKSKKLKPSNIDLDLDLL